MQAQDLKQPQPDDLPTDTVSEIVWDTYNNGSSFLTSSWDGMLRYYLINSNMDVVLLWSNYLASPITACDLSPGNVAIAGMASGGIMACELSSNNMIPIGFHGSPICKVIWCKERGFLISLGYDKLIRFWDLNQSLNCQMQIQLPYKTFTACYDYPYLVIGSVGGLLTIINVAFISASTIIKEDSYKNLGIDKASKISSSSVSAASKRVLFGTADGKAHQFDIIDKQNGSILEKIAYIRVGRRNIENKRVQFAQLNSVDVGCYDGKPFLAVASTFDATLVNPFTKYKIYILATEERQGASTAIKLSPNLDFVVVCTGSDWTKGLQELKSMRRPCLMVSRLTVDVLKKVSSLSNKLSSS